MPITRREFDARERSPLDHLLEFLKTHEHLAFSPEELLQELVKAGFEIATDELQEMLAELIERERVESKTVRAKLYYSYRRVMGFRPYK